MKSRDAKSAPRAMIEELPQTDREDEVAKERVVKAGQQQRTGVLVGKREQKTADQAKHNGYPVAKNAMCETESECAPKEHAPARTEQWLVAMEEKGPVEEFLRIHRKQRV